MLLKILRAEGHSMEPDISNGSFFIVSNVPFFIKNPKINDNIIFKSNNKIIVKKIVNIKSSLIYVEGVNKRDSKNFPPLKNGEIMGKVLWIF